MKKSLVAELFGLTSNLEETPKSFLNSRRNFLPNPQYIKRLTEELRVTKRLEIWKNSLAQLHFNLIFNISSMGQILLWGFCTRSENHSTPSIDQWCRKVKNIGGAQSALPGWNRVNWSAKYWRGGGRGSPWPPVALPVWNTVKCRAQSR